MVTKKFYLSLLLSVLFHSFFIAQNQSTEIETAMLYRPKAVQGFWDPSVFFHKGKYYMFSMYRNKKDNSQNSVWLATSENGVFWKDEKEVIRSKTFKNNSVWKMFIHQVGNKFVMNHGAFSDKGTNNDLMRFYTSTDLYNWKFSHEQPIDTKFYKPNTRWDHMYMVQKDSADAKKGYWGYIVAQPKDGGSFGMMESKDGLHYTAIKAPKINTDFEVPLLELGGVEKIGDTYYSFGGVSGNFGFSGYGAYTLRSKSPTGPFVPDEEAYRLCGTSGTDSAWGVHFLPAWVKGTENEKLISNYAAFYFTGNNKPSEKGVWLLPIRKAIVDKNQHLKLAYWEKNDLAKGAEINYNTNAHSVLFPIDENEKKNTLQVTHTAKSIELNVHKDSTNTSWTERFNDRKAVVTLDQKFDLTNGIIIEGKLKATITGFERNFYSGFFIEEKEKSGTAIMLQIGDARWRKSRIGKLNLNTDFNFKTLDITGQHCATVNGIEADKNHSFRLWICNGIFELYIDNLLMQTFIYENPTGKIGFLSQGSKLKISDLNIYKMKHRK